MGRNIHSVLYLSTMRPLHFTIFASLCILTYGQNLPKIASIDTESVTVGGISTGGAFASQFVVAYSSFIKGAGIFAAATNYCFYFYNASLTCKDFPEEVDLIDLIAQTRILESSESIDSLTNLENSKIFISHGLNDATVNPGFAEVSRKYFNSFIENEQNIKMLTDIPANHAVMTDGRGSNCGTANPPLFIEDCGIESIELMFQHLYEDMKPPITFGTWDGQLESFEQEAYFDDYASQFDIGYYYVPNECSDANSKCRLHVYFHGCTMSAEVVGTQFIELSGLLEMADANNIVLLLPQLKADASTGNAYGCWNWNGYLGDFEGAAYGSKNAIQMKGIHNMIMSLLE